MISGQNISIEFCGGTHAKTTKDAARFVIVGMLFFSLVSYLNHLCGTDESSIGKGVRRIVGITGIDAIKICEASNDFYVEVLSFHKDVYGEKGSENSAEILKEYR